MNVELAVATAEPSGAGATPPYTCLPLNSVSRRGRAAVNGWQTTAVRLTGLSGTVHAIGVRLTATTGPVRWRLGGLAVHDGSTTTAAPGNVRITAATGGDLRFAWDAAVGDVRHYVLHRVLPDGTRRFLGGTAQRAYFVPGLQPEQGERTARFEVRAVGELYLASAPMTVTHTW
ncbi:GH85 family endohexosaminidase C-terminal domain-containing protein [Streptomyces sp. NPDC001984]